MEGRSGPSQAAGSGPPYVPRLKIFDIENFKTIVYPLSVCNSETLATRLRSAHGSRCFIIRATSCTGRRTCTAFSTGKAHTDAFYPRAQTTTYVFREWNILVP
jgi:hypothetical protein